MTLSEMIYKRKSVRKYSSQVVEAAVIQKIHGFLSEIKPLYPDIMVRADIVNKENVKCILPWITPQVIAVFSEEKGAYLENVGFMFQQLDLYLQSIGLGTCWLGMGRLDSFAKSDKDDGLKFVIMLAFGYSDNALRSDASQFKRKSLSVVSDIEDNRLEPARLAPSSVNSQPWYFTHDGNIINTYCVKHGFLTMKSLSDINRIDVGIALAHMYVSYPKSFKFFKADTVREIKKYGYVGSFTL